MEKKNMQIPYKVILSKVFDLAYDKKIETNKFRKVFTYSFRMPKCKIADIFNELIHMKLISFENKWYVRLLFDKKEVEV